MKTIITFASSHTELTTTTSKDSDNGQSFDICEVKFPSEQENEHFCGFCVFIPQQFHFWQVFSRYFIIRIVLCCLGAKYDKFDVYLPRTNIDYFYSHSNRFDTRDNDSKWMFLVV